MHQQELEKAKENFGDRLPEFRQQILTGDSRTRSEAIDIIQGNNLYELMDDSFLDAMLAASDDPDSKVRSQIAILTGTRWIWGQEVQNPKAIDIELKLADDVRIMAGYNAVYYGLSVARPKSEKVLKRLAELAIEPHQLGRIIWGVRSSNQEDEFAKILADYSQNSDQVKCERAEKVLLALKDELDADALEQQWRPGNPIALQEEEKITCR